MKKTWVALVLIALVLAGCGRQPTDDSKIVRLEPEDAYASFTKFLAAETQQKFEVMFFCEDYRDGVAVPRPNGGNRVFEFDFQCTGTIAKEMVGVPQHVTATATVRSDHTWYIREIDIEIE